MKQRYRIRVLHLIDNLDLGGAQTAIFAFLQHFDRDRFEVVLASMHANSNSLFFSRAAELGIEVISLSPKRWIPLYFFSLPWLLARGHFQVVHSHLYVSNWVGKPLAKLFRVPVVISHDHCYERFRFDSPWASALDAWANRFADRILVIADSIRRELIRVEHVPAKKIELMRNGLAEKRLPPRQPVVRKTIGAAGRFVPWKRFDRFLKIAQYLIQQDPGYQFLIAGAGPIQEPLHCLAEELGIAGNVLWKGQLPSLDEFFPEIDLFILTSDMEDLPMILVESMYFGVPTATVAVNEARQNLSGSLIALDPNQSEENWAEVIHRLFQDPELLWELGKNGQSLVQKEFMARDRIRRIEEMYEEELGVRSQEPGGAI
jgi:glycosyltransferase involved in cell wall biosynthesis